MAYKVINIKDIYNVLGEKETREILNNYECELNKDVEYFLKEKAIEFSKQDLAETFIILASYKKEEVIILHCHLLVSWVKIIIMDTTI